MEQGARACWSGGDVRIYPFRRRAAARSPKILQKPEVRTGRKWTGGRSAAAPNDKKCLMANGAKQGSGSDIFLITVWAVRYCCPFPFGPVVAALVCAVAGLGLSSDCAGLSGNLS